MEGLDLRVKVEGEQPLTLRREGGKGKRMKIFDVGWGNSLLPSPSSYHTQLL